MNSEPYFMKNKKNIPKFEIKKEKIHDKWTAEEDAKLKFLVLKYNNRNWNLISKEFENKTSIQCFSRFKRIRAGIKKGNWTKEEDMIIVEMYKNLGSKWCKISQSLINRNGKQIRDRYVNILDPKINR